jgi:hypothetical protein
MGNIKSKKSKENNWQSVELSTEENDFLKHFDISIKMQMQMNTEIMRDYLNTIAARNGFNSTDQLEFDIEPESAVVKIRKITA